MILKIGPLLVMSAACVMLTIGCQQQSDEVVKKKPMSQSDSKPTTNPDDAKYREVSIDITGLN